LNVLVDTSVWSLSLRRSRVHVNPVEALAVEELKELIVADRARMMGVLRQEILSGIRSPEQFEKLRVFLRSFVDVPTDTSDFEAAAQMNNQCRGKGITV
jgi:predicted nucleic acid-binding protein